MPTLQNFTSKSNPQKKVRRIYAQPSQATLEFLRNFARTYTPDENKSGQIYCS